MSESPLAYAIGTAAKGGKVHLAVEKTPGNFMILCRFASRWGATPLSHHMETLAGEGNAVMFEAFRRHNLAPAKLCRNCFYGRTVADYTRHLQVPAPKVAPTRAPEPLREGTKYYRVTLAGGMHVYEVGGSGRCLSCRPSCRKPDAPVRREVTVAAQTPWFAVDLARLRWGAPVQGYHVSEGMSTSLGEQLAAARRRGLEEFEQGRKDAAKLAELQKRWEEMAAVPEGLDPERVKAAMDAGARRADRAARTNALGGTATTDVTKAVRWYQIAMAGADLAYRTGLYERIATMPLS